MPDIETMTELEFDSVIHECKIEYADEKGPASSLKAVAVTWEGEQEIKGRKVKQVLAHTQIYSSSGDHVASVYILEVENDNRPRNDQVVHKVRLVEPTWERKS